MYGTFTTNSGLLFSFETKKRDIIFSTSDLKVMHEDVFKGDSELYVGRLVMLNGLNYEIVKITTYSNLQLIPDNPDLMTGIKHKYSHVLWLTVEKR